MVTMNPKSLVEVGQVDGATISGPFNASNLDLPLDMVGQIGPDY